MITEDLINEALLSYEYEIIRIDIANEYRVLLKHKNTTLISITSSYSDRISKEKVRACRGKFLSCYCS